MATVLIVDDESSAVELLTLMLEQKGHSVISASNGREGLDSAIQNRPDLIIMDVLMPVMDGYAFYKKVKKDPVLMHIPVIVLTARGAMESAFEAIGADCFFEKPVDPAELLAKVKNLLEHSDIQGGNKKHQRVLVFGTYKEVVDEISKTVIDLGHEVKAVYTVADILKQSVNFNEDVLILEVQTESGDSSADVIKAVRILPELKSVPILIYSYYRTSDLGSSDFRNRVEKIDPAKDQCIEAGATEYFERYNKALFQERIVKYL